MAPPQSPAPLRPVDSPAAASASTSSISLPYPATRERGDSTVSMPDSLSSFQSNATTATTVSRSGHVSRKRQAEYERFFGDELLKRYAACKDEHKGDTSDDFASNTPPEDYLTVIATQSGDLQAKVLLHGRLYLTKYHLCFRSNILGYKTESIHPLPNITSVKKGTTAKWIQNAIYIIEDAHGDGEYIGYGSLGDRDAMFDDIVQCWKVDAPGRYKDWSDRGSTETLVQGDDNAIGGGKAATAEGSDSGSSASEGSAGKGGEVKVEETSCTGKDHFKELAIDVKLPITLEKLFNLVYRNKEFMTDFYTNDKKLTDLVLTEWVKEGSEEKRDLTYVMHMNNSIGPSKSDCVGSERIVVADPSSSYEIISETQTPDVPSGKKFTIRTRTCLSKTVLRGKPATRMYCTTQCDWSSGSWLKSTITPAVIKGQKEHHQQLTKKIRGHVKAHPDEFGVSTAGESDDSSEADEKADEAGEGATGEGGQVAVKSHGDAVEAITESPVMTGLMGLAVILLLGLLYQWTSRPKEIIIVRPVIQPTYGATL